MLKVPLRLTKSVLQVVVLPSANDSITQPTLVYKTKAKKRRGSKFLRPIEKGIRKLVTIEGTAARAYLDRHNDSNSEEKNGWIKDLNRNISRSLKTGRKAGRRAVDDEDDDDDDDD